MSPEDIRAYVRANPLDWPALNATQRMRLAALLRADLPVGIRTAQPAQDLRSPREAA